MVISEIKAIKKNYMCKNIIIWDLFFKLEEFNFFNKNIKKKKRKQLLTLTLILNVKNFISNNMNF